MAEPARKRPAPTNDLDPVVDALADVIARAIRARIAARAPSNDAAPPPAKPSR